MLQLLRRGQRWLISATIFLVGGVFVLYLSGSGGGPGGPAGAVVELGERRFSERDLQLALQAQEDRYRQVLGDDFNRAAVGDYLEQSARDSLVTQAVLAHEAEEMGLHVSDEEVRRFLREIFRNANGTFDPAQLRDYARQNYGSESRMVARVRDELLVGKFQRLIASVGFVSNAEARDALRYKGEEIQVAYVAIDPSTFGDSLEVDEEAVAEILRDETEHLQSDYEARRHEFNTPEQVQARHILLRVDPAADDEAKAEVRSAAEGILERVNNGEDFASLAEQLSQDPGSATRGGSLGFFSRGQMVAPFEEVAFAMAPDAPAQLVETDFGFHVLDVEEKRDAVERSFDEAARELAEDRFRRQAGSSQAQALAERLSAAVAAGESLTDAARGEGLTLERPDWLAHSLDGTVEDLGKSPELLDALFALPDDAGSSPRIFEIDGALVLAERLDRRYADDETIADGISGERERILELWKQVSGNQWVARAREDLAERGLLKVRFEPERGASGS